MATPASSDPVPVEPRRPPIRLGLAGWCRLAVAIIALIVVGGAGFWVWTVVRERAAIREAERLGWQVGTRSRLPEFLRHLISEERLAECDEAVSVRMHFDHDADNDDENFRPLGEMPQLISIDLGNCECTDAGLAHLARLRNVETLLLPRRNISIVGLWDLAEASREGTGITDRGVAHLAGMTRLSTLDLSGTAISASGLIHLRGMTHLASLELPAFEWTDSGLAVLGNLTELRKFAVPFREHSHNFDRERSISGTEITDAGVARLKPTTPVKYLDFSGSKITDLGLEAVGRITSLKRLELARTRITDAGLAHLRNADNLWYLDLEDTAVTNAGLPSLKPLGSLETLRVRGTQVTDAGIAELRKLLPRVTVHR